jgi:hypothetical protein
MYDEIEIIRRKSLSIFSYRGVLAAEDRSLFFYGSWLHPVLWLASMAHISLPIDAIQWMARPGILKACIEPAKLTKKQKQVLLEKEMIHLFRGVTSLTESVIQCYI